MSLLQARMNGVELLKKLIEKREKELERLKTELAVRISLLQSETTKANLGKPRPACRQGRKNVAK